MEKFESKAISSVPYPSRIWLWYVNNTFVIQGEEHSHHFLQHTNSLDPYIQHPMEDFKDNGSIPFLDTLVSPGPNNTLITSVYRKPTHTNQYLHWDSNNNLPAKYSVVTTLTHRKWWFILANQDLRKKRTISGRHSSDVVTLHGP